MGVNKKLKMSSLIIGVIFVLSVLGSFYLNSDLSAYIGNYDKEQDVHLNSANSGDWLPQITKLVGNSPHAVFIGDANNDGYNDIVVANSLTYDYSVSILLWNTITDDWDPQITRSAGGAIDSVSIGDVDNDGFNDIVAINHNANAASILLWNVNSGDWDYYITRQVGASPLGLVIGDANNDGDNDIITANEGDNTVSILIWNSNSGDWDSQIKKAVGHGADKLFVGDANNDGYNDIAVSNFYDDNVSILLWNAISDDWDSQITREVGKYPRGVSIGDVNNDGDNDIIAASTDDTKVSILLWNNTSGDWDSQIIKTVGVIPSGVFIGDANNDGYNDIATPSNQLQGVSILLWNLTSGDWNPQISKTAGNNPRDLFIGDADTDGDNDIITANAGDNTISIIPWDAFPEIQINSPYENQLLGNKAPSFDVTVIDDNIDITWYSVDGGITNYTFVGTTGIINQGVWNTVPNGTVIIRFYVKDKTGNFEFDEVTVRKDTSVPVVTIISPTAQTFGNIAPNYSVIIEGNNLDTFWYSIDGGLTNYSFVEMSGTINQNAWDLLPNGDLPISFYANNSAGNIGFNEITVRKYVEQVISGYNVIVIIGAICIVSIILNKLRHIYKI